MTREMLFDVNATVDFEAVCTIAENSAHALIPNPINSLAADVLIQKDVFDPNRLFGITTIDVLRAESFVAEQLSVEPSEVSLPVIGGHEGETIMPGLSQCSPIFQASIQRGKDFVKMMM
ncbi:malate dehydrogenase, mitochondrial-like [Drosophila busckii]|uniref:malate dehydrogenase, mitochondrial-like n=1 Tax=Drosophila busckii TaxID=30019 RepID=UPI00143302ED|nr:malate dehydrogenase, mitochondrial-like [Drosophila busckii]